MSVRSKLTMTCSITSVIGQDEGGDVTYASTPTTGVKCFVFGSTPRNRTGQIEEHVLSFQILFNPEVVVAINDQIDDIVNHKGQPVLEHGIVVKIEKNFHPKKGLVLIQAFVENR